MASKWAARQRAAIEGVLGILTEIADAAAEDNVSSIQDELEPSTGQVRRCGRCGNWIVCERNMAWVDGMAWVDATEGDCCEDGVHFPVEAGAVRWLVGLDTGSEQTHVECFAAEAVEAGRVAIRIQREIDQETGRYDAAGGGQAERSYTIVSIESLTGPASGWGDETRGARDGEKEEGGAMSALADRAGGLPPGGC